MNSLIYLVITLVLPSLIFCDDLEVNKIRQAAYSSAYPKPKTENVANQIMEASYFRNAISACVHKIGTFDSDYNKCLKYEAKFVIGIFSENDAKAQCCGRVINFICMKKILTSRCGVPEKAVKMYNDVHFKYWNDLSISNYPNNCNVGSNESIAYCRNGVSKVTWNITLQIAVILSLYLLVFGKIQLL